MPMPATGDSVTIWRDTVPYGAPRFHSETRAKASSEAIVGDGSEDSARVIGLTVFHRVRPATRAATIARAAAKPTATFAGRFDRFLHRTLRAAGAKNARPMTPPR